jgi:hypothetical protein
MNAMLSLWMDVIRLLTLQPRTCSDPDGRAKRYSERSGRPGYC